ncbi:hypothetical protein ACHAXA_004354 [Cyclostephanos tholiformis]|uniref:Uncharacterized protein n=1 Tax=Cyclostephanos tholiformis TaxID=382380 RepID=A0ABD3SPJ2_9STRA
MDTSSFITADFSSFEDFISRLILVPRDDDLCIGAKVASHEVLTVITGACEDKVLPADEEKLENPAGDPTTSDDSGDAEKEVNNDTFRFPEGSCSNLQDADDAKDYTSYVQPKNEIDESYDPILTNAQVPVGYVLASVRYSNDDDNDDMPVELYSMEFSELFSVLRGAAFPLSLVFAPPTENSMESVDSNNGASTNACSTPGLLEELGGDGDSAKTGINELPLPLSTLVSREDAAKYAKLAATELRGRLSRWGYQAATLAADAATQVKELRDEKHRKANDEQKHHNVEDDHQSTTFSQPAVVEKKEQDNVLINVSKNPLDIESREGIDIASSAKTSVELCSIFIQTQFGFELVQSEALQSITTNSVISVRFTKDKACPVGKNGYTFQWYRSNIDGVINDAFVHSCDGESNYKALPGWSLLRGACYAAYQPSVSDVGWHLLCIIKHEDKFLQYCSLPCNVVLEQSLLDSAKKSLLGGQRSISFCNLERLDDLSRLRLKIDVVSSDDFISSSAIFLSVAGGSVDESYDEKGRITHFTAGADPAKPRLFDLTCSPHGRLRLDAANRKSRESLVLALGLANFKGKLTSLTNETALFVSCESEDTIHSENELTPPDRPSLLDAKLAEINCLLLSKDFAITKLQQALLDSDARRRKIEVDLELSRDAERHLKSSIQKLESHAAVQARTIEDLNQAHTDAVMVHERTVKALKNEKAVLQAAIDARDGKIDGLTTQLSELEKRSSLQTVQVSIEDLKSDLCQAHERYSLAERTIAIMKEKEMMLHLDLATAKETASKHESRCIELNSTLSKCESDCKKLKMERNSLRQRAEGLSKEMLRMSKNNSESVENDKLKRAIQELGREQINLMEQIEVVKTERNDALEKLQAAYIAHRQSIRFRRSQSTEEINGSSVLDRIDELESVIASMTDYLSAKDMQIETLKQVNEAILNDHRIFNGN